MIEWTDEDYAMASDVYLKLGDMAAALDAALASALKREAQQRKEASDEQDRLMPLDPPTILDEPISQQYLREQVQKQMLPVREALAECEAASVLQDEIGVFRRALAEIQSELESLGKMK